MLNDGNPEAHSFEPKRAYYHKYLIFSYRKAIKVNSFFHSNYKKFKNRK